MPRETAMHLISSVRESGVFFLGYPDKNPGSHLFQFAHFLRRALLAAAYELAHTALLRHIAI
jgi:hypothetical protein